MSVCVHHFVFARNNVLLTDDMIRGTGKHVRATDYRAGEFCRACFDPLGTTHFVNLQLPGITLAVWGPWERGNF